MQTTLHSVKVVLVDKVSMVFSLNLAYMHLRVKELFGRQDRFGFKNMLFFGGLLLLQPVNRHPVSEKIAQKSLYYRLGCATHVIHHVVPLKARGTVLEPLTERFPALLTMQIV